MKNPGISTRRGIRYILAAFLALALVLPLMSAAAAAGSSIAVPMSGSGYGSNGKFLAPIDAPDPGAKPISSGAELAKIGVDPSYPMTGSYYLTQDIDLAGADWTPIGYDGGSNLSFGGTFDGQGHVIKNLTITGANEFNGLFSCIDSARLLNIGLENSDIDITAPYNSEAGGISAVSIQSFVINCYNVGNISAASGITGHSSASFAGGIIGTDRSDYGTSSVVGYCYNTGNISTFSSNPDNSTQSHSGGICGSFSGSISNCFNTGDISSEGGLARAGGICGALQGSVENCFNMGKVNSTRDSGGICGYIPDGGNIKNCYNIGYISALDTAGGICGCFQNSSIDACYNAGNLSSPKFAGGICGYYTKSNSASNSNCYWNIDSDQIINDIPLENTDKKGIGYIGNNAGTDNTAPLTSAQMSLKFSFPGFDFKNIWGVSPYINGGFPVLRVFYPDADFNFFAISALVRYDNQNPDNKAIVELFLNGSSISAIIISPELGNNPQIQYFGFAGLRPGTYTLIITKPGSLKYTAHICVTGDDVDLGLISLVCGDIDGDGQINSIDLALLLADYGKSGAALKGSLADVDGDGQVNSIDLALLLAGYGKSSITVSPPPPVPGSDVLLASAGTKIICVCGETQWNPAIDCIDGRTGKDSSLGNKWCCVPDRPDENYKYTTHPQPLAADYPHFIVFDMGYEKSFDKYHINNAGTAMGEDKASNTKEWSMWVSDDNVTYVKVDEVTGNTADTYDKTFASPIKARYIKFIIPVADQFPSPPPVGTVRIYNINVYASAVEGTFPPGQAVSLN